MLGEQMTDTEIWQKVTLNKLHFLMDREIFLETQNNKLIQQVNELRRQITKMGGHPDGNDGTSAESGLHSQG